MPVEAMMKILWAIAACAFLSVPTQQSFAATEAQRNCVGAPDAGTRMAACTDLIAKTERGQLTHDKAQNLFVYYDSRGFVLATQQEWQKALSDFDRAIWLGQQINIRDLYMVYNSRAQAHEKLGDPDSALADVTESIRLNPTFTFALITRGQFLTEKGEYVKALADIDAALRIDPSLQEAYVSRGIAHADLNQCQEAIKDFTAAISRNAGGQRDGIGYTLRGDCWRQLGDMSRALTDLNMAVEIQPVNPAGFVRRGDLFRYTGNFDAAIKDYQKVLGWMPDYLPAITGLGLTYERMRDLSRARERFRQAAGSTSVMRFTDISKEAFETAQARLLALNSSQPEPKIPAPPLQSAHSDSIPTPPISAAVVPTPQAVSTHLKKVALVIANAAYRYTVPLKNPRNDGELVAQSLRNIGFAKVTVIDDGTRDTVINALHTFAADASDSDLAMIYYSGHGAEALGVNYLIPVDAKLNGDQAIGQETVPVTLALNALNSAKKLKLIVLDACRNYPDMIRKAVQKEEATANASAQLEQSPSARGFERGFARVSIQSGTLMVYAAKDGQVALDGEGDDSPFATALVQRIATPGVEINKIFRLVRDDVMEATAGRQEPYTYGSTSGKEDYYFVEK
jgi:tetratricopeptide (TPR) repeat protein